MTPDRPLIASDPCQCCDDTRTESDTGYHYCAQTPAGDRECDRYLAVRELEEAATLTAQGLAKARHVPAEDRREMASGICSYYDNAVFAMGGEFDSDAFLARCGIKVEVGA